MDALIEAYRSQAKAVGSSIITWARPDEWPASPMQDWPLASFEAAFAIAVGYLLFVIIGQLVMPFFPAVPGLYSFKFLYNVVQVMLCSYMCIEAGVQAYKAGYTLLPCNTFNHEKPPIGFILYVFYLSKILDFLDTFFIIAEKRWKQLSFLHVYHHTSIFLFYWLNTNVGYDGDVYLTIVLNGLIHTIMYTYYFVTLHVKDVWWKSALTMGQMIQFVVMNSQAIYLMLTGCNSYPPRITQSYLYYIVSLLLLFANFYVTSYVFKPGKKSKKAEKSQ
jgi:elongation of very long chain fatty acids protein 4